MKWKLLYQHYINDQLLEAGTVIGDGTNFPFKVKPSHLMEPVDDEARAYIAKANRPKPPAEILQNPQALEPGQRPGGLGPKADPSTLKPVDGQGLRDAAGNSFGAAPVPPKGIVMAEEPLKL